MFLETGEKAKKRFTPQLNSLAKSVAGQALGKMGAAGQALRGNLFGQVNKGLYIFVEWQMFALS